MHTKGFRAVGNGVPFSNPFPNPKQVSVPDTNKSIARGVFELARLHTREAWLCWYPAVWGACVAAGTQGINLDLSQFVCVLFGIWSSVTATHCLFCTFNDIVDRNLDLHVERCKVRPIPAGLISTLNAILAFLAWIPIALGITYMTLGPAATLGFIPVWVLSTIYPFMKRVIPFPQVVLGAIIGGAVFPGWAGVTGEIGMESILKAMPLFAATATWVVYFDVFYATQDRADDAKIGVKSLAVLLGRDVWIFLSALGLLQVVFFAFTAMVANLSLIFWVLGLGVWTLSIPRHIWALDLENRTSGGKIFKANIKLGLYLTGVMLLELASTRVYLGNVKHLLRQGA